jgi:hypothetical protein
MSFDGGKDISVDILVAPADDGGVIFEVTEADNILRGETFVESSFI